MTQDDFLVELVQLLKATGVPFMVAGSLSSSYHGLPRTTNDIDLVIDPTAAQLDRLVAQLGVNYYVSSEAAREALAARSIFNVIHFAEGWKADLIVRKDRPFSHEEFHRRQPGTLHGEPMDIASPEDVILTKLEWNRITPSERQVRDALNVAKVQGAKLECSYLRHWAPQLGVSDELEELLRQAATDK